MWALMVSAAQTPVLQWSVVAAAVVGYVLKLFTSGDPPLMGDMYQDEPDL
jgi:steroid 5-alpha reductase family enzyme